MRDRRVELREKILDLEARPRLEVGALSRRYHGVGGVKTCQACGNPGRYAGWNGAVAAHHHGMFIASNHRHAAVEIEAACSASAPRFCTVCGAPTARPPRPGAVEPDPLCAACASACVDSRRLSRSRWLDELHPTERSMRERLRQLERVRALEGTAPLMEIARLRLVLGRALRRLQGHRNRSSGRA